ncbi:MAG: hypothetical protein AB1553_00460 [Nitrospirota bacterium]
MNSAVSVFKTIGEELIQAKTTEPPCRLIGRNHHLPDIRKMVVAA